MNIWTKRYLQRRNSCLGVSWSMNLHPCLGYLLIHEVLIMSLLVPDIFILVSWILHPCFGVNWFLKSPSLSWYLLHKALLFVLGFSDSSSLRSLFVLGAPCSIGHHPCRGLSWFKRYSSPLSWALLVQNLHPCLGVSFTKSSSFSWSLLIHQVLIVVVGSFGTRGLPPYLGIAWIMTASYEFGVSWFTSLHPYLSGILVYESSPLPWSFLIHVGSIVLVSPDSRSSHPCIGSPDSRSLHHCLGVCFTKSWSLSCSLMIHEVLIIACCFLVREYSSLPWCRLIHEVLFKSCLRVSWFIWRLHPYPGLLINNS